MARTGASSCLYQHCLPHLGLTFQMMEETPNGANCHQGIQTFWVRWAVTLGEGEALLRANATETDCVYGAIAVSGWVPGQKISASTVVWQQGCWLLQHSQMPAGGNEWGCRKLWCTILVYHKETKCKTIYKSQISPCLHLDTKSLQKRKHLLKLFITQVPTALPPVKNMPLSRFFLLIRNTTFSWKRCFIYANSCLTDMKMSLQLLMPFSDEASVRMLIFLQSVKKKITKKIP